MKKINAIILALLILLSCAACSGRQSAKSAFSEAMNAIKSGDSEKAAPYIGADNLILGTVASFDADGALAILGKKMTYKIKSCDEDGDSATLTVEVTNVDMTEVFADFMTAKAETPSTASDILLQSAVDKCEGRKTNTFTVNMNYSDGWHIDVDKALADAVLGGIVTAINKIFG